MAFRRRGSVLAAMPYAFPSVPGAGSRRAESWENRAGSSLDCYWLGALDSNLLVEIKGFSTKPNEKGKLFAEGSTATK